MLPPDYFPAGISRGVWRSQTMLCFTATFRQKVIKCLLLPHSNPLILKYMYSPTCRADVWIWSHAMLTLEWPTNLIKFVKKTSLQRHRKRNCLSIYGKLILLFAVWFTIVGDTQRSSNCFTWAILWMIGQQRSSRYLELVRESLSSATSWPVNNFVVTSSTALFRISLRFSFWVTQKREVTSLGLYAEKKRTRLNFLRTVNVLPDHISTC